MLIQYDLEKVKEFLNIVKDENPIHQSEEFSKILLNKIGSNKKGIIMPGLYSYSLISKSIPESHNHLNIKFKEFITHPDSINVDLTMDNDYIKLKGSNSLKEIVMEIKSEEQKPENLWAYTRDNEGIPYFIEQKKFENFCDSTFIKQSSEKQKAKAFLTSLISGALWQYSNKNIKDKNCFYMAQEVMFYDIPNILNSEIKTFISINKNRGNIYKLNTAISKNNELILNGEATCAIQ